jgi:hypothetical protein
MNDSKKAENDPAATNQAGSIGDAGAGVAGPAGQARAVSPIPSLSWKTSGAKTQS